MDNNTSVSSIFNDTTVGAFIPKMVCPTCGKAFSLKHNLTRHLKIHSGEKSFQCVECEMSFARQSDLNRHMGIHTEKTPLQCGMCSKRFTRIDNLRVHEAIHLRNFTCAICLQVFSKTSDLNRHIKSHERSYRCRKCSKKFGELDQLERHEASHLRNCTQCSQVFKRKSDLLHHIKVEHSATRILEKRRNADPASICTRTKISSLKDMFSTESIFSNVENDQDLAVFLQYIKSQLVGKLSDNVAAYRCLKWYAVVTLKMSRECENGETEYIYPHFRSNCLQLLKAYDIEKEFNEAFEKIKKSYEEFTSHGSGWILEKVIKCELNMVRYGPLSPNS